MLNEKRKRGKLLLLPLSLNPSTLVVKYSSVQINLFSNYIIKIKKSKVFQLV